MKHAKGTKDEQNNKQNILCESDESSKLKIFLKHKFMKIKNYSISFKNFFQI